MPVLGEVTVDIQGVGSIPTVYSAFDLSKGDLLTEEILIAAEGRIRRAGRFSLVRFDMFPGRLGHTDLVINIVVDPGYKPDPGFRVRIDRVEFSGNWKTR